MAVLLLGLWGEVCFVIFSRTAAVVTPTAHGLSPALLPAHDFFLIKTPGSLE